MHFLKLPFSFLLYNCVKGKCIILRFIKISLFLLYNCVKGKCILRFRKTKNPQGVFKSYSALHFQIVLVLLTSIPAKYTLGTLCWSPFQTSCLTNVLKYIKRDRKYVDWVDLKFVSHTFVYSLVQCDRGEAMVVNRINNDFFSYCFDS